MNDPHWERKMREKFSFLYPSEQASKEINRGIVIGLAIVVSSIALYAVFQTSSPRPTSVGYKCPTDSIDWQVAVLALLLYNNKHGIEGIDFHNMDQAEIERHFEEHCQQDIQIYNDFVDEHSLN